MGWEMAIESISNSVCYTHIIILTNQSLTKYDPHFVDEETEAQRNNLPTVTPLEVGKSCLLTHHIDGSEISV